METMQINGGWNDGFLFDGRVVIGSCTDLYSPDPHVSLSARQPGTGAVAPLGYAPTASRTEAMEIVRSVASGEVSPRRAKREILKLRIDPTEIKRRFYKAAFSGVFLWEYYMTDVMGFTQHEVRRVSRGTASRRVADRLIKIGKARKEPPAPRFEKELGGYVVTCAYGESEPKCLEDSHTLWMSLMEAYGEGATRQEVLSILHG